MAENLTRLPQQISKLLVTCPVAQIILFPVLHDVQRFVSVYPADWFISLFGRAEFS